MNTEKSKELINALKKLSRHDSRMNVNELRIIVALERAIARLQNNSKLSDHLIFKGGFVLLKHFSSQRLTRDADALAIDISKEKFSRLVSDALIQDLNDGLWFGDVKCQNLEEQGKYGALRFDTAFQIGEPKLNKIHKLSRIHIDVGFSDHLIIKEKNELMKPLFDISEPVSWKIYPLEQIISEKLETLFQRGIENSRAKDIYDLINLIPLCKNKKNLMLSIKNTFNNRSTPLPDSLFEGIKKINDLTTMKTAWPGVKALGHKPSFDEAWTSLIKILENLDPIN